MMNEVRPKPALLYPQSMAVLAGLLILCVGGGAAIGIATAGGVNGWYNTLKQPAWTPPNQVFGPVWTLLYSMMAVAMWLVWRGSGQKWRYVRPAATCFAVQMALNFLWTPVFFQWHQIGWALLVILLLDLAVSLTILVFAKYNRLAAGLLVPYLVWCLYATSLNAGFLWLNATSLPGG